MKHTPMETLMWLLQIPAALLLLPILYVDFKIREWRGAFDLEG